MVEQKDETARPDNPPAFSVPGLVSPNGDILYPEYGMSLRDYFAAKAMAGMLSAASGIVGGDCEPKSARLAALAYGCADAMLIERSKE
jgi:hypothetical protein